jgi:hypothetical protein
MSGYLCCVHCLECRLPVGRHATPCQQCESGEWTWEGDR